VSQRWQQIELLYSEALKHSPSERTDFLRQACAGDNELRAELESLLAEVEDASSFLSSRQLADALRSVVESPESVAPPRSQAKRPLFFWCVIAVGFLLLGFYGCSIWVMHQNVGAKDFGWWESSRSVNGSVVGTVDVPGPAAGILASGDRILAFNGDPRAQKVGATIFRLFALPGSAYTLRIERRGQVHDFQLRVRPWHGNVLEVATYFFLSIAFYIAGLALGLLKPQDRVAQLGSLALLIMVMRALATPLSFNSGTPPELAFILNQIASFTFPGLLAVTYHFLLRMTARPAPDFLWRVLRSVLYAVSAVLLVSQIVFFIASLRAQEVLVDLAYRHFWIAELNLVFLRTSWEVLVAFALAACCAVVIWGYRHSADPSHRRRIRWFAVGCAVGMAPELGLNLLGLLLRATGHRDILTEYGYLRWTADCFLVAIPASLTYAILKHRLLDIRIIARRSLRYVMARRALQFLIALPFLGLILPIVLNPNRTMLDVLRQDTSVVNLALLLLAALGLIYRRQTYDWLDKKFFRAAYRQEELLQTLIGTIRDCESEEDVCKLVCRELNSALHPKSLLVWSSIEETGDPIIIRASESGPISIPAALEVGILQLLRAPGSVGEGRTLSANGERSVLTVIPVSLGNGKTGGGLLLGEKKSEEPYTRTDLRLMEAIANSIGTRVEGLWLKRRVDESMRERQEVLGRLDRQAIKLLKECLVCGACFDSTEERCPIDRSELTLSLPVERTIANRYRLNRRIGSGGMGVVFEATDLYLNRAVATKVMTGRLFGDRIAMSRFEREAQVLARLNHPHVVAIHDYGRLGGDGAFLVMELLAGPTWRAELKRLGRIPPATLALWFDQLLSALHTAHQAGIIHRDLKPENVIISSQTTTQALKILDFGLAKMTSSTNILTTTGVIMGTKAYTSPEQLRGEVSDARGDIFSAGVMAVEAITGQVPARVADGNLQPSALIDLLGTERAEPRLTLCNVLRWCLAERPDARCSDTGEMRKQLVNVLRSLSTGIFGK